MPLLDYIEKLRAKPEAARWRILFSSVAGVGFVVFIVWIITLKAALAGGGSPEAQVGLLGEPLWGFLAEQAKVFALELQGDVGQFKGLFSR
jgi:hypothetical protein